jgi:hypothetical protein
VSYFVGEVSSRGHVEPGSDRAGVDAGTTQPSKKEGLIRKFTKVGGGRSPRHLQDPLESAVPLCTLCDRAALQQQQ